MNNITNDTEKTEREIFIKKVNEGLVQIKTEQVFTYQQVKQKVREWASDKTK